MGFSLNLKHKSYILLAIKLVLISFPKSEMNKFKTRDDLDRFLFEQYSNIFFNHKGNETEKDYAFYMHKKAENKFYKG